MGVENIKTDLNEIVSRKVYTGLNKKLSPESANRVWVSRVLPNWIKDYISQMSKDGRLNKK